MYFNKHNFDLTISVVKFKMLCLFIVIASKRRKPIAKGQAVFLGNPRTRFSPSLLTDRLDTGGSEGPHLKTIKRQEK